MAGTCQGAGGTGRARGRARVVVGGCGEMPGGCPGWDATPGEPVPSAPRPPTMSISLVRELTRSETEERGSVLRSDSSCGGCPGTGAVFTALPPAGNLREERQHLRGGGLRAGGETARGSPSPLLPAPGAAGGGAAMAAPQGHPGQCHRRLRATRCSSPAPLRGGATAGAGDWFWVPPVPAGAPGPAAWHPAPGPPPPTCPPATSYPQRRQSPR